MSKGLWLFVVLSLLAAGFLLPARASATDPFPTVSIVTRPLAEG